MKSVMESRILRTFASRARVARVLTAVAFAGLFAAGCKGTSEPGVTASLTISPTTVTLAQGGTQQFTVVAKNSAGDILAIPNPIWSVTAGGGTITSTGLYTAGTTAGTFTVSVTCNGVTATATVIVSPGALLTITVTPNPATLAIGATQQFTAVGKDANGNVVAITPVWSTVNPPGSINAGTGFFTAGNTAGTFPNTVRATQGTIFGTATVIVTAGPLLTITVTPNPATLATGATQQFTAVGTDAFGNVVPITPVWSTVNPPGSINAVTGLFTAGNTTGTFPNTVRATQGTIFGTATVIVIAAPPPALTGFTVLGRAAVTCTTGSIIGDVGTNQAPGDAPPGSITPSCGPVTTGTVHAPGDAASKTAYSNFLTAYTARAPQPGDCDATHTLTGTLAGVTLTPGVYCFSAGAALTGTLTLNGTATGLWLFKIGTTGTGDLTGTNFTVIMAGAALPCNVTWWVRQAASMTDSFLKGTVIAGTGVTVTNGTFNGNMWAGASGTGDATETNAAVTGCP